MHNPFTTKVSGMSGSPVIMDAIGKFVGFMSTRGYENSTFSFDGKAAVNENGTINIDFLGDIELSKNGVLTFFNSCFWFSSDYLITTC